MGKTVCGFDDCAGMECTVQNSGTSSVIMSPVVTGEEGLELEHENEFVGQLSSRDRDA
jgi:hypothetical protein